MVITVEAMALAGPLAFAELGAALEYATGLGVGMADLPAPAIEWHAAWHATHGVHG